MQIHSFYAKGYRNIGEAELEFEPGINLLCGENAQGKTNIIEGIYTFARGKSFRGAGDAEQVKFGEKGFSLSLSFHSDGRDQSLSYTYCDGKRERKRNGAPATLREMLGRFRAVLFTPEHLSLIKGGPSERRLFLNIAISQLRPDYMSLLSRYQTVLENRNTLLKQAQKTGYLDTDQLDVWNHTMAELCARVALLRQGYISLLSPYAKNAADALSGGREKLFLSYEGDVSLPEPECGMKWDEETVLKIKNSYYDRLSAEIGRESAAGCSLFGIHRDDMEVKINGLPARTFASQGQQRSAVLALKSAEGEVSFSERGETPVYLFDDVLSELDGGRRSYILSEVGKRQVIITACNPSDIGETRARIFHVEEGRYVFTHR